MSTERVNTNPDIQTFVIKKNKYFPNSKKPVIIYKGILNLPGQKNKASVIAQKILLRNGWTNTWINGIYDFHHYHSTVHECLAISSGKVTVIIGGPGGRKLSLTAGDVIILPAGTGHKCVKSSEDFICVGAYPRGKNFDINYGKAKEYEAAIKNILKLTTPLKDPILGKEGFLKSLWK